MILMKKRPLFIFSLIFILCISFTVELSAANQNILANPEFELLQDGKLLQWTNDVAAAEPGFAGARAGRLVNDGKVVRVQQFGLGPGLVSWYGEKLELECSMALFAPNGNVRVFLYFESMPDKYCMASRVPLPGGRWMRLRMRFPAPSTPLKAPKMGLALESGKELLMDCAYFGPATTPPLFSGESMGDFQAGEGTQPGTRWSLNDLPSVKNLLLNPSLMELAPNGRPLHWSTTESAAAFTKDREFRLSPATDGCAPWIYEAPATTLSAVPSDGTLAFSIQMTTHGDPSSHFALEAEFLQDGKAVVRHSSGAQSITLFPKAKGFL